MENNIFSPLFSALLLKAGVSRLAKGNVPELKANTFLASVTVVTSSKYIILKLFF